MEKELVKQVSNKLNKKLIKKKLKDQVTLLNDIVKLKLAPSNIHGVGVFAMRNIKKGEKIYADIIPHQFDLPYDRLDELYKDIRSTILGHFPLITEGSHFMYPVTKFTAYLNHSDNPNYDSEKDIAIRDVSKNEEITEDYRLIKNHEKIYSWLVDKK